MDDRVLCVFATLDSTSFAFDCDKIHLRLDSTLILRYRNFQVQLSGALATIFFNPKILKNCNLHAEATDIPTKNKKQMIKNLMIEVSPNLTESIGKFS